MEITISDILNMAGWLIGGGSIGGVLTWRWTRRKEKAEAQTAEVNMAKEVQDIYQQALKDKDEEVADKNRIINELREDRDHFRQDRNELRDRLDKTDETIRNLQKDVARNGRQIEAMRPFMCYVSGCRKRQLVELLDHATSKKHEIEPSNED